MCGHCGCDGVDTIGELREEHLALAEEAHLVRRALADGDRPAALERLNGLVAHLTSHVRREERGVFAALREQGDFGAEVVALEGEHVALDGAIAALDPDADGFGRAVLGLLDGLDEHIEREDLGIFPVSVVTLGAAGWATVEQAHAENPSFLSEGAFP